MGDLPPARRKRSSGRSSATPGSSPTSTTSRPARSPTRPARAVWTAISRLREVAEGASGPEFADLILSATDDPAITSDYLTRLALSAPTPDAASAYGRLVAEAALTRDLAAATASESFPADPVTGAPEGPCQGQLLRLPGGRRGQPSPTTRQPPAPRQQTNARSARNSSWPASSASKRSPTGSAWTRTSSPRPACAPSTRPPWPPTGSASPPTSSPWPGERPASSRTTTTPPAGSPQPRPRRP